MILGSITDILLPILGISIIPPMSIILVVGCISGMCYAIIKYKLMNITAENVLLNVFKLMSGGLIILDDKDEIISINKGAQNILECNEADVVNVKIDVFVQFDVTNTEFAREEVMMNTAHNKSVPVLMSCAKLYDEFGSMLGTVLSFQDITYIKNMQSELLQAHNQLEDKVAHRTKQLTDLNETLKTEIETRKMKEAKIEELAFSDQLTGLSNRRYFFIQLARDIHKANRDQKSFAVLFMDLDGFKMINDSLGHEVGDLLLIEVANILKKVLRKTDLLSRVGGGDEFIVLLHYPCQKEAIVKVCEHIIRNISEPIKLNKNEVHITTSIGVSVYPHDGLDAEILIKNADIAMYKAKEKGKGRYAFFNNEMKSDIDNVMRLTNDLYKAMERDELEVYYQPQIDVKTKNISGYEALIRWNHPNYGLLSPGSFIPLAERTGLIIPIGRWVLESAFRQIEEWQVKYDTHVSMAINLSVRQLQNFNIVETVYELLEYYELEPSSIELEITENILLENTKHAIAIIKALKELGIQIAIDDFGTEYSSLSYLKDLPVDRIKIAKTFIDGVRNNNSDESIISTVIILGKKLGMNIIAEGVEHKYQYEFLDNLNCDDIQGFYFYRPLREMDINTMYEVNNNKEEYV